MLLQHPLVALLQAGVTSNSPEIVTQVILKMSCHSSFLSSSVLRFSIQEWFFNEMRGWVTVTWVHTHCSPGPCGCLQLWQCLPPFGAQLFALGPHWQVRSVALTLTQLCLRFFLSQTRFLSSSSSAAPLFTCARAGACWDCCWGVHRASQAVPLDSL